MTNPTEKNIFTTHEVSRLLQVNPRSVINWIEQKKMESYRTPGGHRRIRRDDLLAFVRKHKIPIPAPLAGEKFNILIVEDEADDMNILKSCFEGQDNYDVVSASDGISALIEMGRAKPDVLVLDILIPGVNGIEVCRRIKADPANRTAIIAISGKPEMETEAIKAGADAFLLKPLDPEKLQVEVNRLLRVL